MEKSRKTEKNELSTNIVEEYEVGKHAKTFTDEQKKFIFYEGKNSVIFSATAGSGKTYCCVHRLRELIRRGVDPKKIVFFSFTRAAVEELKERIGRDDIKVTTIHAFAFSMLHKMGKNKEVTNFFEFIDWYKERHKPERIASEKEVLDFEKRIANLYDDSDILDSNIASYKLQAADGIKVKMPEHFLEYSKYLKEERKRDFSDILIEVRNLLKENKWLKMFKDKYEYVFLDEYQDTSTIQMEILMRLNAKYYYLVGDINQSIYGYSGVSCGKVEQMLEKRRTVETMTLSTNFRSGKLIVEHSNKFSNLEATPFNKFEGEISDKLITFNDLVDIINNNKEVVILARTNYIIKLIEVSLLKRKVPIKYFNYLKEKDIEDIKANKMTQLTKKRLNHVLEDFEGTKEELLEFIEKNKSNKSFVTTIHRSKGKEFDTCIVVNSISEEILDKNNVVLDKDKKELYSFFPGMENYVEEKNIHYVSVSRPKKKLYFMLIQTK
jgi:DNA helicase-2/ATP-dependent DNA helicase PcrA